MMDLRIGDKFRPIALPEHFFQHGDMENTEYHGEKTQRAIPIASAALRIIHVSVVNIFYADLNSPPKKKGTDSPLSGRGLLCLSDSFKTCSYRYSAASC
jgi:hypothetical protein